jgi:transposase
LGLRPALAQYWIGRVAQYSFGADTAWVVNAHRIKHVPGRKTDMADSEWLAVLARLP